MRRNYKFEVVGGQELLVRVPLPIAEVWAEMQLRSVEERNGIPVVPNGLLNELNF